MGAIRIAKHRERTGGVKIAMGIGAATITTIAFALILSAVVSGGKLTDTGVRTISKLIWLLSAAIGVFIGIARDDQMKLAKGAIIMVGYLLVLITISVVSNQMKLQGIIPGILCSTLGCLVACGVKARGKNTAKRKRR